MTDTLPLILLLLAAAVVVVVIFRMLGLPPIMGYLLVGAGARAACRGLGAGYRADAAPGRVRRGVPDVQHRPRVLAGAALQHEAHRVRPRPGPGAGQHLVGTLLARFAGIPWLAGIALGGALAMSSTAMLSKLLTERGELDAPHGREVIGVLLFQDIAVVPLLVLIPALSQPVEAMAEAAAAGGVKAAVLLALVLVIGQRAFRRGSTWWRGKNRPSCSCSTCC
jgi:CPA2 family monovalent cation:H+ antiporter-2